MTNLAGKSNGNMQVFENSEFGKLEVMMIDGKPYFPATECAKLLGYANPHDAIRAHCKGVSEIRTPSKGGTQTRNFIPEGDLYRLIIRSKLPTAERFERWVCDDVLPAIRKHGAYALTPRTLQEALRAYADELDAHENTRKALAASNEQVEDLKVRLDESESFWSILTLCEKYGFDWDIKKRGLAGKRASAYCRRHGYEIRRAHDDRFGEVNAYPCEVLDKLFVAEKF